MNDVPSPPREDLVALRAQGLNRDQIAVYYGVALSRVKRWIKEMNVPANPQSTGKAIQKATSGQPLGTDYGLTLLDKARSVLGSRMGQDYRGYLLDGRPVRVDMLIRSAGLDIPQIH